MQRVERQITRLNSVLLRYWLKDEFNRRGNFVVTGFPKSGTTWITQLMADSIGLKFSPGRVRFSSSGIALHTHGVSFTGSKRIIYVVRDPREVVCSAYRAQPPEWREEYGEIDLTYATAVLTRFPGSRLSWNQHVEAAIEKKWQIIHFEDAKRNGLDCLLSVLNELKVLVTPHAIESSLEKNEFEMKRRERKDEGFLNVSAIDSWKVMLSNDVENSIFEMCAPAIERLNTMSERLNKQQYLHSEVDG